MTSIYELNLDFIYKNGQENLLPYLTSLYGGFWRKDTATFINEDEYNQFIMTIFQIYDLEEKVDLLSLENKIRKLFEKTFRKLEEKGLIRLYDDLEVLLSEIATFNPNEYEAFLHISACKNKGKKIDKEFIRERYDISDILFNRMINLVSLGNNLREHIRLEIFEKIS